MCADGACVCVCLCACLKPCLKPFHFHSCSHAVPTPVQAPAAPFSVAQPTNPVSRTAQPAISRPTTAPRACACEDDEAQQVQPHGQPRGGQLQRHERTGVVLHHAVAQLRVVCRGGSHRWLSSWSSTTPPPCHVHNPISLGRDNRSTGMGGSEKPALQGRSTKRGCCRTATAEHSSAAQQPHTRASRI